VSNGTHIRMAPGRLRPLGQGTRWIVLASQDMCEVHLRPAGNRTRQTAQCMPGCLASRTEHQQLPQT
jgi:hypothetical protein